MKRLIQKLINPHKNNKLLYYATGFVRQLFPASVFRRRLQRKLSTLTQYDASYILSRVNYYNKMEELKPIKPHQNRLIDFKLPKKMKVYYFDSHEYTRYFNPELRVNFLFGDITHVPDEPSIVKSRPIHGININSILLKLNKVRHFIYTNDRNSFPDKKNMLVWRGVVVRPNRIRFFEQYFNNPMCEIGQINNTKNIQWLKTKLTIDEQLQYKFILCLEGYDVASNLKWVMSSRSLAVMPKPTYETWFMEGRLIANHHYILIKDDFSDLEERLTYYIKHPEEALQIIENANQYCQQFKDKKREDLISLMVLNKYFLMTGQVKH